jgi:hypothetical protein
VGFGLGGRFASKGNDALYTGIALHCMGEVRWIRKAYWIIERMGVDAEIPSATVPLRYQTESRSGITVKILEHTLPEHKFAITVRFWM